MRGLREDAEGGLGIVLVALALLGLTGLTADLLPHGVRWLWRQAALVASPILVWSVVRLRASGLDRGRGLGVAAAAALVAIPLVLCEGTSVGALVRTGAWVVGAALAGYVLGGACRRRACVRLGEITARAWRASTRHPGLVALVVFTAGFGVCALRARHGVSPLGPITGPDSFCYVLQAKTFLSGRLSNPSHPHWEFFQVLHVVTQPFYQAKYPPGYAMTLAVGLAVGVGRYVPAVLMGLAAAGTFSVGRRLFGVGTGLLAALWLIVLPKFGILGSWQMSNTASVAVGVWLLEAMLASGDDPRRPGPYVAGGLLVAYHLLLRPLDAVLLGGPILLVWTWRSWRRLPRGRALGRIALLGGLASLGLLATGAYNLGVTGSARAMPYAVYEHQYTPGAEPPPGVDVTPLTTDSSRRPYQRWERLWTVYWSTHPPTPFPGNPGALPRRLETQARLLAEEGRWTVVIAALLPLAVFGGRDRRVWFLLALAVLYTLGYGFSKSHMTRYLWPIVPFVVVALVGAGARMWSRRGGGGMCSWSSALPAIAIVGLLIPAVFLSRESLRPGGAQHYEGLIRAVSSAPGERKLVFLDYDGWHLGQEYAYNGPLIDEQDVVFAHDLKERNQVLMEYYPDRFVYRYVLADASLHPVRAPR